MKICTKCKKEKNLDSFGNSKIYKDGKQYKCKDCITEINKEYYQKNYKVIINKHKKAYEENKDDIKEKYNLYYQKNKVEINKKVKTYREAHKDKIQELSAVYCRNNKTEIRKRANKRYRERLETDILFKFKETVRGSIKSSYRRKGFKKTSKTATILGCSFEELQTHLRDTFELNYGIPFNHIDAKLLHIDHIIPICTAKTKEDVIKLNHYTNLQYLFKWDNLEKGTRI